MIPGSSPTGATRWLSKAFIKVDLPTLGVPRIIIRSGFTGVPRPGSMAWHSLRMRWTSLGFFADRETALTSACAL